ncbi:MAG: bacterioferritin [Bacteriovoracia bacterium]
MEKFKSAEESSDYLTGAPADVMDASLLNTVVDEYTLDLRQACKFLNEALASEILCVLRYRSHQVLVDGIHSSMASEEFEHFAKEEFEHVMLLAMRLRELGSEPDLNPASATKYAKTNFGSAKTLYGMIREDLVAEKVAIGMYRKMIKWFGLQDPTTRKLLEHILSEEEHHAHQLASMLEEEGTKPMLV